MIFSFAALITNFFFSSLLILLVSFFLRSSHQIRLVGVGTIFFCIIIIMLRLFIPFEFLFSTNILSRHILPAITQFVRKPITAFYGYQINFLHILYFIWGTGVLVNLIKAVYSYWHFKKAILSFPVLENQPINDILHNILKKYDKPVALRIIQSDRISTPMIFGFHSPCIAVPGISLTEREWYYILSHEVAHYFHGHLWNKVICEFLHIIYWWNPFVYLLKKQMKKTLEIQVDLTVTKPMDEASRIEYLECLLKIARNCVRQVDKLALTFSSEQKSTLSQRFYMVLNNYDFKVKSRIRSIFLFTLPTLLLVFFSCFFVFEPYYIDPMNTAGTFELTNKTSYLVSNPNGGYDVYLNDEYISTVHDIDSFSDLPIYQNTREAQKE